jgi:hypothetical protein
MQICPNTALPLGTPLTVQLIMGLEVCATDAENVCRAPGTRTALDGLTLTRMLLVSCKMTEPLSAGLVVLAAEMVTCRATGMLTGAR